MKTSIFFSVLIAIAALVFAFQNNEMVEVSFFGWGFAGSLALIIIASLLLGFIIGFILVIPGLMSSKWNLKKQNTEIKKLKKKTR